MADARETAGRLIFAAADHDGRALLDALRPFPRTQNLQLVLALAETAALALEALHGEEWREALNLALLEASIEGLEGDDGGAANGR